MHKIPGRTHSRTGSYSSGGALEGVGYEVELQRVGSGDAAEESRGLLSLKDSRHYDSSSSAPAPSRGKGYWLWCLLPLAVVLLLCGLWKALAENRSPLMSPPSRTCAASTDSAECGEHCHPQLFPTLPPTTVPTLPHTPRPAPPPCLPVKLAAPVLCCPAGRGGIGQAECEWLGCCWNPSSSSGAPPCFHPGGAGDTPEEGYTVYSVTATGEGGS